MADARLDRIPLASMPNPKQQGLKLHYFTSIDSIISASMPNPKQQGLKP